MSTMVWLNLAIAFQVIQDKIALKVKCGSTYYNIDVTKHSV